MPLNTQLNAFFARRGPVRKWLRRHVWYMVIMVHRDLRSSEPGQIAACAVIGTLIGAIVAAMHRLVNVLHKVDFLLPGHIALSAGVGADPWRIAVVPAIGGLVLGVTALIWRKFRSSEIIDPIEANALYGGRMSLLDSARLTLSTIISNASGASLGMEAGYSQFGSGVFAAIGRYFHLRRADQRMFVSAGAAAAIAAAFNAPLTGAFYGYELVLGSYTPRALAPVAVASVCGVLMLRALGSGHPLFESHAVIPVYGWTYVLFGLMGILAAGVAISAMKSVTWVERTIRQLPIPVWARPAVGGLLLSAIALFVPQVLGSGHGAIQYQFQNDWSFFALLILLVAKLVASAISVGSGFRGGLFSSSLLLGCLFGGVFAKMLIWVAPALAVQYNGFLMVGMGSVAAAVIGAPFTMIFLVLEATGDFPVTVGVLVGVVTAATIVRLTFGYSFATWRFHIKGIGIRGAHDVGWIASLTVRKIMRAGPQVATSTTPVETLRAKYHLGAEKRLFMTDKDGLYIGSIDMAALHDPQLDEATGTEPLEKLIEHSGVYAFPGDNIRTALKRFEASRVEAMPVLAGRNDKRVIGYITEAFALRRYTQELEQRRSAELGEQDLFSLGQTPPHQP